MAARLELPPGPSLLPIVGLGIEMQRDILSFFSETARSFGPLIYLGRLGLTPAYLVNDPALTGEILQTRWREFVRDDVLISAGAPVFGRGLLFARADLWSSLRRTMQPAFTQERLASLVELIHAPIERCCARLDTQLASERPVAMADEMARLTQEVFVRAMFGASIDDRVGELLEAWDSINEYVTSRIISPFALPGSWPTPANLNMRRKLAVIDDLITELLERRRGEPAPEGPQDLLGLLLAARDPETDAPLSEELLREQILMTFFAGFETTSMALAWVWILLDRHREVERRLHAEIDEQLGGSPASAEQLARLSYTQQVLDETLRLYPSVFMLARQGVGEPQLGDYRIRAGAVLFLSPYLLHHDPKLWPEPERFDPERFAPGRPPPTKFSYLPFGAGPRLCIGKPLALLEAKLIIATLAQRFRLRTLAGVEYRPQPLFTLRHEGDAPMRVERRSPSPPTRDP